MYSPVSGSFGNIKKDPVIEIINRAADSTVLQLFVSKRLEEFHIKPGPAYCRQIEHPCKASTLIAMIAEKTDSETKNAC